MLTVASEPGPPVPARVHVVLVPGFAGFDALGQVEYYAGTTDAYQRWKERRPGTGPVVLHYFDNLPTAGVATRSLRLRRFLAKLIARGEIDKGDRIALVGHSTGGLDIRALLRSLRRSRPLPLDGGAPVDRVAPRTAVDVDEGTILDLVARVVFLSVPQFGTNIADWVRGHRQLQRAAIAGARKAVDEARFGAMEEALSLLLDAVARATCESELALAARDAVDETRVSSDDPTLRAAAAQAGSALRLWLAHAVDDFGAIDDLASLRRQPHCSTSPAHVPECDREAEVKLWREAEITTMSVATIARRGFRFTAGRPAPMWSLRDPRTWPTTGQRHDARKMDVAYLLASRACAGGGFTIPDLVADECRDIAAMDQSLFHPEKLVPSGPAPGSPLEPWDNDGIVNTASMLWPDGAATRLVAGDHLDVVGHYVLRETVPSPDPSGRRYAAYDALRSHTGFTDDDFDAVWSAVFDFCAS